MTTTPVSTNSEADVQAIDQLRELYGKLRLEIGKVIIGQDHVVEKLLTCIFARGHALLMGVPGLAKTLLIHSLADVMNLHFSRIQFTPDLMPSDITGTEILQDGEGGKRAFEFIKGPVFANIVLADEINRAPAKTQAAMLEAMQEHKVTVAGRTYTLDSPFFVLATQNPIEQEGTYPLPEAQLDRFLLKILIDYPDATQEASIVRAVCSQAAARGLSPDQVTQICAPQDILDAQAATAAVDAVESVVQYAVALTRATRTHGAISLGAGTRGAISLIRMAKAYAFLDNRHYITPADVKRAALPVLRHRITLAPEVAISGQSIDTVRTSVLNTIQSPRT